MAQTHFEPFARKDLAKRAKKGAAHNHRLISVPARSVPLFVFLHISKTAGTTMRGVFNQMFGEFFHLYTSNVDEVRGEDGKRAFERDDYFDNVMLIAGHFARNSPVVRAIGGRRVVYISIMRDPVERAISHYDYIRRMPWHRLHKELSQISLLEAATKDTSFREHCQNAQMRVMFGKQYETRYKEMLTQDNYIIGTLKHLTQIAQTVANLSGMPSIDEIPRYNQIADLGGVQMIRAKDQPDYEDAVAAIREANEFEYPFYQRVHQEMLVTTPGWRINRTSDQVSGKSGADDQLTRALLETDQPEAAIDLLQRAAAIAPQSAAIQSTLCQLYTRLGRSEEALEAGGKALELDPDQLQLASFVGDIQMQVEPKAPENKTALRGADGYLFHEVDQAFFQMCGDPVLPVNVDALARIVTSRYEALTKRGIAYRMLIVPERHVLYDDKLPEGYTSQSDRMAVRLPQRLREEVAASIVYPYQLMRDARAQREICLKQDVHWTGYGAYLGYKALLESVPELAEEVLPESAMTPRIVRRVGDMGFWEGIREREQCELLDPPPSGMREVMSTKTFKTGQVDVIETDHPSGRKLVLFRTSNSTALIPMLAHHFARIVSVATTAVYDEVIESEEPGFVFSELPERYLAVPMKRGTPGAIRLPQDFRKGAFTKDTDCQLPLP